MKRRIAPTMSTEPEPEAALERELAPARFFQRAAVAGDRCQSRIVESEEEGIDPAPGRNVSRGDHAGDHTPWHAP